jgi:NAD(P)-dependent dehydrogenase (short-subunit alcohol dehydrogenase family)
VICAGLPGGEDLRASIRTAIVDIRDDAAVHNLVDGIPGLDVVVNAAGIIRRDKEFEVDTFAEVVNVNLTGVMRVCRAGYPKLAESKGSIINIASMLSFFGGGRVPAYSASKGGVVQLTRSLAIAWAADHIRVNAIAPGWISTPLTEALQKDSRRSAELVARTPMGRWGTPEEVAGTALFLASESASFVTGAVIPVDGGYSAF